MNKFFFFFFFSLIVLFSLSLSQFSLNSYLFCSSLLLALTHVISLAGTSPLLAHWPNGVLDIFSSFSSLLPSTCLTSLTLRLHLCDLTFLHHFRNVAGLLYVITEKKRSNSSLLVKLLQQNPFHHE